MYVMAGLLVDAQGRVLLAERPAGKHLAGFWEFPGGKLEPAEQPLAALSRELREELGIELQVARPLIRVPWRYGDLSLLLDAWIVDRWTGTPQSMEGQALDWRDPALIDPAVMTPADRPILQALRLPQTYVMTPDNTPEDRRDVLFQRIVQAFQSGTRLLQLRLPLWSKEAVRNLAVELLPAAREQGAQLLLVDDIDGARSLGVGVHLSRDQFCTMAERPLSWQHPVGVSCDDLSGLLEATKLCADFAVFAPSRPLTEQGKPEAHGRSKLKALIEEASLPIYVIDPASQTSFAQAAECGAQGLACELPA